MKSTGAFLNTTGKVDVTQMLTLSESLNLECRLTVSNHTQVQQYASSACPVCEAREKPGEAYWGTFATALMQDLCVLVARDCKKTAASLAGSLIIDLCLQFTCSSTPSRIGVCTPPPNF